MPETQKKIFNFLLILAAVVLLIIGFVLVRSCHSVEEPHTPEEAAYVLPTVSAHA